MKFATIAVLILCIVAIAAFFLLRGRQDSEAGGFRDWVKNPDYKRTAAEYFAARDALTVPDDISGAEIQHMVDQLFVEEDDDFNFDRLELVGEKAVPLLIDTLSEDRTRTTAFSMDGEDYIDGSPFERICDLLEPFGPPKAVPALLPYTTHANDYFRKTAAITLGNIGSKDCVVPITRLLDDDDGYVRSYAMMGIERGIEASRCTDQFLNGVFPSLAKLLNRDDGSVCGTAPRLLLAIDRESAIRVMLSDDYLSTSNEELHYILEAFNEVEYKIPHDKLLPLLASLEPVIGNYPHDYSFAAGLIAYSHNPDADTESYLAKRTDSKNELVAEAATEGVSIVFGVTDPSGFVFTLLDERGWDNLTKPQQHYYAVLIYNGEVNNGGHSQYFVNSSGDFHGTALEGLSAVGAKKRAAILADAVQLFGKTSPSIDSDKRHEQLARFSRGQDMQLDGLNSRYYDCDENVDVLLSSYALKNKEHFSRGK